MTNVIAYTRVSTIEQQLSGAGLEGQRVAIEQFCKSHGLEVLDWFQDIQSGKGDEATNLRKGLNAAFAKARMLRCKVIVAKLDRLSRDVGFIANLMKRTPRPFVSCDLGLDSDDMVMHMHAVMGQNERKLISHRTKVALAARKAKGVRLGNPRIELARVKAIEARKAKANQFAERLRKTVTLYLAEGMSQRKIAEQMNQLGISTPRGCEWSGAQVGLLLRRYSDDKSSKMESSTI
jgi:DNA invertase Pin-like site-specific DNA recombinase